MPTYATTPQDFKTFDIGSQTVVSGDATQVPTAVSLYTAPAAGAIEAGIPHISFDVAPAAGVSTGTPILFAGIGVLHASNPSIWDLVDNQVYPLRGIGHFDTDLIGGGVRLLPGDQLGVLIFGLSDQFAGNGNANAANLTVEPLTITGKAYLPLLRSVKSDV